VHAVYQTLIFVLESVVFSLIGLELPTLTRALTSTGQWLLPALAVTATLIVTRIAWVFPLWAAVQRRRGARRPDWAVPAVISWAGTRGVVPLAAALSIPLTTASGAALPQRDLVVVTAAAAIVCSLLVQGSTLEPLARAAGLAPAPAAAPGHEDTIARLQLAEAALARLDELADGNAAPDAEPGKLTERQLRADLIAAENAELARLFDDGTISSTTRQRLQQSLDLELARLTDHSGP
jgi:CPA1 family monovalent cation:H+ antiporter